MTLNNHDSSLSDSQQIILSVLMMVSATLSIVGSSSIVYRVALNPRKTKSYDRIMLGLSCADIISSLSFLLSPILVPAETSSRVWAMGTNVSCAALGWLRQLGFSSLGYNAFLSIYYVMILRFDISTEDFAASYEAFIHVLTIFYFLVTATGGFLFQVYSELPVGIGCWVSEGYCFKEEYCIGELLSWFFGAFAIIACFVILMVSHLVIYFHIRGEFNREGVPAAQSVHIQRVAIQGFLYVISFCIAFVPASILRYLEVYQGYNESKEAEIYGLLVVHALCMPLQGKYRRLHSRTHSFDGLYSSLSWLLFYRISFN